MVADQRGDVIQETLYDPFGGIIEASNPACAGRRASQAACTTGIWALSASAGATNPQDSGFGRRLCRRPEGVSPKDGANHYDTFTGRWTAPDPLGDAGGDPDWYGYCLDDPVNGVDPLGLLRFGENPVVIPAPFCLRMDGPACLCPAPW